jgi:hypothetical protein
VNKKVPYNQSNLYDGYRTDSAGFISMSWGLNKPSLGISAMKTVSHNITKAELK